MVYAGFLRRFIAAIIDIVITMLGSAIIIMLVTFKALVLPSNHLGNWILSWIPFFVSYLYGPIMESSSLQATLGKLAIGIKVTDLNGNRTSFGRALGRNIAKLLSTLTFFIGFFMAAFTEKKQALHDILAQCLVVRDSKASNRGKAVLTIFVLLLLLAGATGYLGIRTFRKLSHWTPFKMEVSGKIEPTELSSKKHVPEKLTEQQYDVLLSSKVVIAGQGNFTSFGPAAIQLEKKWSDINLNVWLIPLPNLDLGGEANEVVINHIWDGQGKDLFDPKNSFESGTYWRKISFTENNFPFPHLEGTRKLHFTGANADDINRIEGTLILQLPIEVNEADFDAASVGTEKVVGSGVVTLEAMKGSEVLIRYKAEPNTYWATLAYDSAGQELKPGGFEDAGGTSRKMTFHGQVNSIKVLFASRLAKREIPFDVKK